MLKTMNHCFGASKVDLMCQLKVERLRSEATEKAMRKVARAHMKAEEMRKVVEAQHAQRLRKVTTKEKESPFPKCFGSVLCIKKMIYTK